MKMKNNLYNNELYRTEINDFVTGRDLSFFKNKTICITGGTGLIMSYFTDVLLFSKMHCKIILLVRNKKKAQTRFSFFKKDKRLVIKKTNLLKPIHLSFSNIDIIIHGASHSDQRNYASDPIGTMHTNYIGINHLLRLAVKKNTKRFLFLSSSEIYGDLSGEITEDAFGHVNPLSLRSCYNESKRAAETLCFCYAEKFNLHTVIARLSRVYGPTMNLADSKALSQFMMNAVNRQNIQIKSSGEQVLSYTYVSDAVAALFLLLKDGMSKNAYNIANNTNLYTLKEIAEIVAKTRNIKTEFIQMTETEKKTYSEVKNAVLSSNKLENLGWSPAVTLEKGISQTIDIIENLL